MIPAFPLILFVLFITSIYFKVVLGFVIINNQFIWVYVFRNHFLFIFVFLVFFIFFIFLVFLVFLAFGVSFIAVAYLANTSIIVDIFFNLLFVFEHVVALEVAVVEGVELNELGFLRGGFVQRGFNQGLEFVFYQNGIDLFVGNSVDLVLDLIWFALLFV